MAIALSAAVRSNLLALQQIANDLTESQKRLATGRRVNSAADNPSSFFTASALSARAAALNTVADGIGTATSVLRAASTAIESIQFLISTARDAVVHALNSPSTLAKVTGSASGLTVNTPIAMDNGDTITVSDGTTTATYVHAGGNDVQDFIDAVNNQAGLQVDAALVNGRIQLTATSTNSITIGGTSDAAEKAAIGLAAGTTPGSSSALRQSLSEEFDTIRQQISELAADAGFNGQNLLGGSTLTVQFNENGTSSVTVTGSTVTAASLGINAAAGNFQSDVDINAALSQLDAAAATLKSQAASYESSAALVAQREDFARSMSEVLATGADNMVLGDMNEEGAKLLALRAHQQLALTALSLTTKAESSVLRLFGS